MNDENRNSLGDFVHSLNGGQTNVQAEQNNKEKTNPSIAKRGLFGCLGCFGLIIIVMLLFSACGMLLSNNNEDNNEKSKKVEVSPSKQVQKATPKEQAKPKKQNAVHKKPEAKATTTSNVDFNMTAEELKNKFNQQSKAFGADLRINSMNINKGFIQYEFSDRLRLMAQVNEKTNKVDDIALLSAPTGDFDTSVNTIVAYGIIIAITNPTLEKNERGDILDELGMTQDDLDITTLDYRTTVNHVHYHSYYVKDGVILLSATMR